MHTSCSLFSDREFTLIMTRVWKETCYKSIADLMCDRIGVNDSVLSWLYRFMKSPKPKNISYKRMVTEGVMSNGVGRGLNKNEISLNIKVQFLGLCYK